MVFTQGRGFGFGDLLGLPRLTASMMCFGLQRRGHRLFGNVIFFGKLFGVATFVDFGEKRCRKNLPLDAASHL